MKCDKILFLNLLMNWKGISTLKPEKKPTNHDCFAIIYSFIFCAHLFPSFTRLSYVLMINNIFY